MFFFAYATRCILYAVHVFVENGLLIHTTELILTTALPVYYKYKHYWPHKVKMKLKYVYSILNFGNALNLCEAVLTEMT